MKIEISRRVDYTDVNPAFRLKLGVLFRYLQAAAVEHSECVGLGSQSLVGGQTVWVLNKIGAIIHRYPTYREDIRIVSWHRGKKGLKAYRDFLVFSKEECLAEAASMWLYLDLDNPAKNGRSIYSRAGRHKCRCGCMDPKIRVSR